MEPAARIPYSVSRPTFDLITGGQRSLSDWQSDDIVERLETIEIQTADIHRTLQAWFHTKAEVSTRGLALWRVFWPCQIIGFVSLVLVEMVGLTPTATKNLKFAGLGLIFVALESALVAKFKDRETLSKEDPTP